MLRAVPWLVGLLALTGCGAPQVDPGAVSTPSVQPSLSPSFSPSASPSVDGAPSPTKTSDPGPDDAELSELAGEVEDLLADSTPVLGSDISWPQCPPGMGIPERPTLGLPGPLPTAQYVVIGLTNGPGFTPNPCLADQVDLARSRNLLTSAYAVASYPDAATLTAYGDRGPFDGASTAGALANTGYRQALFNVASMRSTGLETPIVWIDVEHVPGFAWSSDVAANAAVVRGVERGYRHAGYRVGVYSTPYIWTSLVGDLALGVPEWRAAGQTSRAEALSRCGDDWVIQGGAAVLAQWVEDSRDLDVTCPGVSGRMGEWFHQY